MAWRLALVLLAAAVGTASGAEPIRIALDRCTVEWSEADGVSVLYDDQLVLGGDPQPVYPHPPDWSWGYRPAAPVTAALERRGDTQVLRLQCADAKVRWTQTVTAGPGDRVRVAYSYRQLAWDEAVSVQVCLFRPAPSWLAGAEFHATGPGGKASGRIPDDYESPHPFGAATRAELLGPSMGLTLEASRPLMLFDYPARNHFWLGCDEPLPRGEERGWSADLAFEGRAIVVRGVRLEGFRLPSHTDGERLGCLVRLGREAEGPGAVTCRLVEQAGEPVRLAEQVVALSRETQAVPLAADVGRPGKHRVRLELLLGTEVVYTSTPVAVEVPRVMMIAPGRSPYMAETRGEALVRLVGAIEGDLRVAVEGPGGPLHGGPIRVGETVAVPLDLGAFPPGHSELSATLYRGTVRLGSARCDLYRLPPKDGAVVIDNRSHGLVCGGLPFIPVGMYTDFGIARRLAEVEAPYGFTVIGPYMSPDIAERRQMRDQVRALFDRCAALGMYVHFDIRAASRPPQTEETWAWLEEEITAFRDHPALLAYYLADEPELGWAKPENTTEAYRRIKELDPYHPVTMVFCQSGAAAEYADGMDLIMTDPYPIPNGPITQVVDFCERIRTDTLDVKPLWLVPQAFGGGEWWAREPSRQEERAMVYLGLVHGVRGVQFFVRRPPVGNPTSPDLWSECRRLALEIGQLTPALASDEQAPVARCDVSTVHLRALRRGADVTLLAVNQHSQPSPVRFELDPPVSGTVDVLFENRSVMAEHGTWTDTIEGFGTRVYRISVNQPEPALAAMEPANLIANPSFEDAHNVGTPDGAYISLSGDPGATWFVDPRLAAHGRQSLRLSAPADGQGLTLRLYPVTLEKGKRYRLSVWARGDRPGQRFSLTVDAVDAALGTHELATDWQQTVVEFAASEAAGERVYPRLELLTAGKAWFDLVQLCEME
ncbi:MAG TPA: hypothetical protein PLD23_12280 [Armatimonadota bacterium]|nr:hypothetical protein [Armatimonadota bacterium]